MKKRGLFVFLFFFTLFLLTGREAASSDMAARGDYLTVKVVVSGPGDEIYFWWGHIALLIEDSLTGQKRLYDWGLFSFEEENFYYDFAFGRLNYSCGVSHAEPSFAHTSASNRDLTLYTLDLPPEAKAKLFFKAEESVLPENRNYLYHHFGDNCATRVRDIIDFAVDGTFKELYENAPGRFTLRQHVRRHTWFSPFWDWLLNFWMGQGIDQPMTVWEEMFLPSEIALRLSDFTYFDDYSDKRQLVSEVEVYNQSIGRPAVLDSPPQRWTVELVLGLCIAAVLGFLRLRTAGKLKQTETKRDKALRGIFGITQAALGLFFGIMGLMLFFLMLFTDHSYTYHNSNLIFINPLFLAAVPAGIIYAFTKNPKKHFSATITLEIIWTLLFLAGIATIVMRALPGFYQQNQPTQLLTLPFLFVLSTIPSRILRFFFVRLRSE